MTMTDRLSNRSLYVLSSVILVIAALTAVWVFRAGVRDINQALDQYRLPGTVTVNVREAGNYTLYHEYRTTFDGAVYDTKEKLTGLQLALKEADTGQPIELLSPTGTSRYTMNNREGVSVRSFRAERAGKYVLEGKYANGEGPPVILVVGKGFMANFFLLFLGAGLGLVAVAAPAALTIIAVDRKMTERRRRGTV